jgi:hypothetical protein
MLTFGNKLIMMPTDHKSQSIGALVQYYKHINSKLIEIQCPPKEIIYVSTDLVGHEAFGSLEVGDFFPSTFYLSPEEAEENKSMGHFGKLINADKLMNKMRYYQEYYHRKDNNRFSTSMLSAYFVSKCYGPPIWELLHSDGEIHARFEDDDDFEIEFVKRGDVYVMCGLCTSCTSHNM